MASWKSWIGPLIVLALALKLPWLLSFKFNILTQSRPMEDKNTLVHYFYNEVTGEVQWEDPGDVPFEDENGERYWQMSGAEKTREDPATMKYVWIEQYSEELKRAYFYNQETRESSWERPSDLAWRRIKVSDDP